MASVSTGDDSFPEKVTLSDSQYDVLKTIMQGKSVFYTGAAGTGKSFILRILQEILKHMSDKESIAFTSPTGVAACNIGGMTIHSWAGIGLGSEDAETLCTRVSRNKVSKQRWNSAKILVIDEISMMSAELFDKLNIIGQRVRDCSDLFGGIQLILCGDFYQLPPVAGNGSKTRYCFESDAWKWLFPISCSTSRNSAAADDDELNHNKMIVLSKIFRQKDSKFINILNEMRCGKMSAASIEFLRLKCAADRDRELVVETSSQSDAPFAVKGESAAAYADGKCNDKAATSALTSTKITPTRLFSVNRDVDEVNARQLRQLSTDEVRYQARDTGDEWNLKTLKQGLKVPEILDLRVGAQVMLLKNLDVARGLANGTRGKVVEFVELQDRSSIFPRLPKVEFYCTVGDKRETVTVVLSEEEWTIQVGESVKAARSQIPLMLAWAISIHKAQGMTIPFLEISFQNIFEYGQAYVSISRATDLDGLILRNFDASRVKAHATVVAFYKDMGFDFLMENADNDYGENADGGGVRVTKGTVTINTEELIENFQKAFETNGSRGSSCTSSSKRRKLGSDKGWVDTKTVNKNIPPWMVQREKDKRKGESARANYFFLPREASAKTMTPHTSKGPTASVASTRSADVGADASAVTAPFCSQPTSSSSSSGASAAVDRFASRFVSAAGRGVLKGKNVFDRFNCEQTVGALAVDGDAHKFSKVNSEEVIVLLSDDSNSQSAPPSRYSCNDDVPTPAYVPTPVPHSTNIWDFFAGGETQMQPPSLTKKLNSLPPERPFQTSKSTFVYSPQPASPLAQHRNNYRHVAPLPVSAPVSIPVPSMRSIIASTQAPVMPPGVISVPPGAIQVPGFTAPGVCTQTPSNSSTGKPVMDAETKAKIERNRLAAVKRLQETRRRAEEDARAVLSNIMEPDSNGGNDGTCNQFQYI